MGLKEAEFKAHIIALIFVVVPLNFSQSRTAVSQAIQQPLMNIVKAAVGHDKNQVGRPGAAD